MYIIENYSMTRRIGNTTYHVNVHFNDVGQEDMSDKILRMIRNDPDMEKWGSTNSENCGMISPPQMSRQA